MESGARLGPNDVARLLERLEGAALLVDLSTRAILKANGSFLGLSRYSPEEIAAIDLVHLHDLKDLERILSLASRTDPGGTAALRSVTCHGKDGATFTANISVTPLFEGGGALALIFYGRSSGGSEGIAQEAGRVGRPSLTTFTRWLAAVRGREGLGQVVIEASLGLMATDRALLVGPGATEVLASAGLPAAAQETVRRWLAGLMKSGQLSADLPRIVEDAAADEGLAAGRGDLADAGIAALVVLPLESDDRLAGAWVLGYADGRRARASDIETGRAFAAHIAGIQSGVLLLERTRREKSHHEVLNRIISWLRGPFDPHDILQSLSGELCRTLEADRCVVLVANEADDEPGAMVRVEAEHAREGLLPVKPQGAIPFGSTALGQAVLYSKEPLAIEDIQARPDLSEDHEGLVRAFDLRGLVMARIVSRQEFIGLVAVATAGRPRHWAAEEIDLVRAVADHTAVTLETARLARASQERAEQIERERREWERTFDAIPDMLSIHDGYGRMLRANLTMQVRLGGDPRAYVGRECGEILEVVMGRSSGCPHEEATRARRAIAREVQGERGAFALTAIPCFDAAGSCLYIIHVCKEITEEKQIREQLLQSEKMAAVGSLVSGVAHELNNPLAGVIGFSELLLERQQDPKLKKSVERIRDEAERAARIVKNLLTFARKHRPESVMVDINSVLEKTLELRAYELRVNKVKVAADLAKDLPKTLADPNQLLQVFMNVITNAEQAMKEAHGRGTLSLRTSAVAGAIRVTLADDGPGIAPQNIKKIFDPFFTTKPIGKGTGLGLSICHGIIKEHGGTISAASTAGQGTTFTIELPVVSAPERRSEAAPAAARKVAPGRILVVDDELNMREVIADALAVRGHSVDAVEGGQAALEAIRRGPYEVVISDLKMPEMDGQELYARLQKENPDLARRVIFTSGDSMSPETRAFLEGSGRPYLFKPFKVVDMVEQVEKLLPAQ
jgi:nitrogen-specific signal transduction histidine kinase/GAF domain-containing protein/CheY-like chemotaxis protein